MNTPNTSTGFTYAGFWRNLVIAAKNFFKGGFIETTFVGSKKMRKSKDLIDQFFGYWMFILPPFLVVTEFFRIRELYTAIDPQYVSAASSVIGDILAVIINTAIAQRILWMDGDTGAYWALMQKYKVDTNQAVFFQSKPIGKVVPVFFISGRALEVSQFKPLVAHGGIVEFFIHNGNEVVIQSQQGVLDKGVMLSRINKKTLQKMIDGHIFPVEEILNEIHDSA